MVAVVVVMESQATVEWVIPLQKNRLESSRSVRRAVGSNRSVVEPLESASPPLAPLRLPPPPLRRRLQQKAVQDRLHHPARHPLRHVVVVVIGHALVRADE